MGFEPDTEIAASNRRVFFYVCIALVAMIAANVISAYPTFFLD